MATKVEDLKQYKTLSGLLNGTTAKSMLAALQIRIDAWKRARDIPGAIRASRIL